MHFGWRISEFRIGRIIAAAAAGILVAGVLSLAGVFVVAPFGNAAPPPTTVRIGRAPVIPPGTAVLGPALSSTSLTLDVVLTPRDPTVLAGFIDELYDPDSTDYH